MKHLLLSVIFIVIGSMAMSQTEKTMFSIPKRATITLNGANDKWGGALDVTKLPKPDQGADDLLKQQVKKQQEDLYRSKRKNQVASKSFGLLPPGILQNFAGNGYNYFIPCDNDMGISDSNVVSSVTNTLIWSKNLNTGQVYGSYSLHNLTLSLGLQNEEFDPKMMYDPQTDRFVFVCLNGFEPATSNIVIGFSQTNLPYGAWNFYVLPGNPLSNNLWTDFPMLAITEKEVFLTVNLLYPDSTWQAGFNETIIWQLKKSDGYSGNTLTSLVHSNIQTGNRPLRNLCPVKGGSQVYGPNMYFLSNRNFDASNDTTFLVELTDTIGSPNSNIVITPLVASTGYHMPPDADQPLVTDKLATNDARVLGAYLENDVIQFTGNCLDTVTGNNGFYHGIITDVSTQPTITATIYVDTLFDLGYPNIAYAGNGPGDNKSLISILYSSVNVNPSCGAILYDGVNDYSPISTIKAGMGYYNQLSPPNSERWGDYTGCQRKYNEPGKVWMSVQYGLTNHQPRTWIAEVTANSAVGLTQENSDTESSLVFPNPVSDRLKINFELAESGRIEIVVHSAEGKQAEVLFRGSVIKGPNAYSFNTNHLVSGIYFLTIMKENGEVLVSEKFIKD